MLAAPIQETRVVRSAAPAPAARGYGAGGAGRAGDSDSEQSVAFSEDEEGSAASGRFSDDSASSQGYSEEDEDEALRIAKGFFGGPRRQYIPTLTAFGTLWTHLNRWATERTAAYLRGVTLPPPAAEEPGRRPPGDGGSDDDGEGGGDASDSDSDGGAPRRRDRDGDGRLLPSMNAVLFRSALATQLAGALPPLMRGLHVRAPESELGKRLSALAGTFRATGPLPTLGPGQWEAVALAMLDGLSRAQLPVLADLFAHGPGRPLVLRHLVELRMTVEEHDALVALLLGDDD
jgi:hypothetical protein